MTDRLTHRRAGREATVFLSTALLLPAVLLTASFIRAQPCYVSDHQRCIQNANTSCAGRAYEDCTAWLYVHNIEIAPVRPFGWDNKLGGPAVCWTTLLCAWDEELELCVSTTTVHHNEFAWSESACGGTCP